MSAPGFWFTPARTGPRWRRGCWPRLGALYAAATARRLREPGYRAAVPVICIGNLNAGGTGKTPTAIALVERLAARGSRRMSSRAGMAGGWPGRCGWTRRATRRPRSGTSRCCWPPSRRSGWRATGRPGCGGRGGGGAGDPAGRRVPEPVGREGPVAGRGRCRDGASATAAACRPGRCASRWRRAWRGPTWCCRSGTRRRRRGSARPGGRAGACRT